LTRDQVDGFGRDGIVFPVPAIGAEDAAEGLRRLEAMEAARAGRLPPRLNAKPHLLVPWLWDLVHDPRVVDAVEDLLGPELLCWGSSFISKQPGDGRYVSWHQDATYWGLAWPKAVTAWIALTPSTPDNGCVRAVPGSHDRQLAHGDTKDPANLLGRREVVLGGVDEGQAVDVVLEPGQMSLHDVLLLHGSGHNRSAGRRVGFAVRYVPGRMEQVAGARATATLVRGRDHGHFELESRPEEEFHPDALARHAGVLRRSMEVIFDRSGGEAG
jgi:hypothetical protein